VSSEKITLEAIEALEREGLGQVVNALAGLLNSPDGLEKHGVQGWVTLGSETLYDKMIGHLNADLAKQFFDRHSSRPAILHFLSRAMQYSARTLKGLR
jgi:hypothetical protein